MAAAFMLLTMMASTGMALADNASYVFNTDDGIAALGITKPNSGAGTSLSTTTPYVVGQISMTVTHGSTDTRVWNSNGTLDLRIYKSGGSLTFAAATGYKITGIAITGSTTNKLNVDVGTYSSGSWSNGTTGATSVKFTASDTGKINTITVTYESIGGGSTPSITASNVSIAYDATQGSIGYTLNNATGNVTAEVTSGDWLTLGTVTASAVPFTCSANTSTTSTRTATVTLSFTGAENKVVTVTQGKAPITIAEARTQATGNSVVTRGVVTSCVGTTGYIQDATAAICVYGASLTVGDEILVSGTLSTYKGLLEITSPQVAVLSQNNTVTPTVKTIAEINSDYGTNSLQGLLVKIENATVTNIDDQNTTISQTISNTTSTIIVRGISGVEYAVNDVFSELTGNIGAYNAAQIANPTNVIVQQNTAPVINASNPETLAYNATSGEIAYNISNPTDATLTATLQTGINWISNIVVGTESVTFDVVTNDGTEDRTATITLSYTGAENKVITVTQGHYVVDYATLPFNWTSSFGTMPTGVTNSGVSTDSNGTYLKFDDTADYIILKINERPGTLTYSIKANPSDNTWEGTFKVQASETGTDYSDVIVYDANNMLDLSNFQSATISNLGENVRYIKWVYITKTKGNVALNNINLAAYVDPSTVPSIDADAGNDLAYNATNGSIAYEIENYVDGEMSATTTASWIEDVTVVPDATVDELGDVTFNVTTNDSTNPRTGTITLTFTFGNSQIVTKDVTVTQAGKPAVIIESPIQLTAAANENGTIDVTYANFTPFLADDPELYVDANCETAFTDDWITVSFATISSDSDYNHIDYMVSANDGAARTVYMKVEVSDENSIEVSTVVTINQAAYSAPGTWVQCDLTDLTPADVFVIVGAVETIDNELNTITSYYAMSNNNGTSKPSAIEVTVSTTNGTTLSGEIPATIQWNLAVADSGYIFYPAGDAEKYLYCGTTANSGSNDNIKVGTGNTGRNVFELGTKDDNYYLITNDSYVDRYVCVYNNSDWRGYVEGSISANNKNITNTTFFKKVSPEVTSNSISITHYEGDGGYYLIASPVNGVVISDVENFTLNDFDLYMFNQSAEQEWINYEQTGSESHPFTTLISGKGYLYANSEDIPALTFTGQPYNGNGVVGLIYDENAEFAGWNLIGNPFANPATLDMPYYKMNDDGDGFTANIEDPTNLVGIMEGVFVQATAVNQTATFTAQSGKGEKKSIAKVELMLNGNKGIVDNAIVRFDEGQTLEKFMLNANGTKLYFTENNKDYAIVRSNNEGEMPVNFKASANGTYTLSVNPENVEMNYLHLIDNMTGADVDLLATPSYSFEAKTSDYASRFRLVFSANDEDGASTGSAAFAYYNGSEWMINNQGEATLQVIDMMGRVLSSETLNGNATINVNETAGIYMLRLVNGENVRTPKVVVR